MKRITLLHLGLALALTPACGDDGVPVSETEEGTDDTGTADTTVSSTQSTTISTTVTPETTGETDDPPVTTGETEDPSETTGDTETTTGDTESTTGDTESTTGDTEADTGSTGVGEVCGNGEIEGDEECDDGDDNADTAACKSDCTNQFCGDTFTGPDEACDDGNTDSNDGCSSMCLEDGGTTCEAPYYVDGLPYSHDGDTTMAGNDYATTTCGGVSANAANNESSYAFTPTEDGIYTVAVDSASDFTIYIATDCADIDGTCVDAVDDGSAGVSESLFLTGTADTTYFIHTGYWSNSVMEDAAYTLTIDECIPADCDGSFCGDDGCGGMCGCADGEVCDTSGDDGMCVAQPPGDTCEMPIVVDETMLPFSDDGDTLQFANDYGYGAGVCPGEPSGWNSGAEDVVYSFTPAATGVYTIAMDAGFDSVVYIVTDCSDIDNSCFQAVDAGNPETLIATLEADTTYFIIGGHFSNLTAGSGGDYTLTISDVCTPICTDGVCGEDDGCGGTCGCEDGEFCDVGDGVPGTCEPIPVGDTCDDAAVILQDDLPYSDVGDTLVYENDYSYSAGACPGETGGGNGANSDVVYTFTPDVSGLYDLSFAPSAPGFDSTLYIATDCDDVDGTCLAAADNGNPETIQADLAAGTTYYFFGGAWSNSTTDVGGEYTFSVGDVCVPTCDEVTCDNDNGCGGTCGCADGDVCIDGTCDAIPAGDTCGDPVVIGSVPFSGSGTTTLFNNDYGVFSPACPGVGSINQASDDVVFSYTAEADGDYLFEFDTGWDNAIYVVTDCADIDNTCIGGVDAVGSGAEDITVTLTNGVTYFFIAGPYQNFSAGAGGDYTANLTAL